MKQLFLALSITALLGVSCTAEDQKKEDNAMTKAVNTDTVTKHNPHREAAETDTVSTR